MAVARANGAAIDPVLRQRLARSYVELEILRIQHPAEPVRLDGPVAPPEASIIKLYWARLAPAAGRVGDGRPGCRPAGVGEGPRTSSTSSSAPSCSAGPRPSTGDPTRSSETSSASGCSASRPNPRGPCDDRLARGASRDPRPYRQATGCSTGKVVVVPPRPGPASGLPPPSGAWRRGPPWSSRDAHERRLGEAADAAGRAGRAPLGRSVRRDRRGPGPRSLRRGRGAARRHRRRRQQRRARGQVDVVDMTDEQWAQVLDMTLTGTFRCNRAALRHFYAAAAEGSSSTTPRCSGGGPRPGRPTTRRPKPGSWPSPGARRWRPPPTGCGSTPSRPASPCTPSSTKVMADEELDELSPARGLRAGGRGMGGGQRHRIPGQRVRHLHDRRGRVGEQPAPLSLRRLRGRDGLP